jgi:argininosuccinate lyase
MNECPLGAAALAGTSFPIDRVMTARELRFSRPMRNSLDAVSSRDFVLEALSAGAICATHLSRLAEEIVLWTSAQFRFVTLSDRFTTGSSIMPQKRNPDAAELVRAKAGRIAGSLMSLLMVMKGLPLAYGKDMQEDKEPAFDALNSLALAIAAMAGMVDDLVVNAEAMRAAAAQGYATATDLADWLVRAHGMPFREAHRLTGRIVALAEERGVALDELSLDDLQRIDSRLGRDAFSVLTPEASVASRKSFGGTAPVNVRREAARWLRLLNRSVTKP